MKPTPTKTAKPAKPAKPAKTLTATDLAFTRLDAFSLDRLLVLRVSHTPELKTPSDVLGAFEKAITSWVENSPSGFLAYQDAGEDFNIGDFCSTNDFQLQASLEVHGIHSVETLYELSPEAEVAYDYVLAHPNFEPETLYREDGQRFSRNPNGTYSNDKSTMANPYTYSYSHLMETGKFSRTRPKAILRSKPSTPSLE